MNVVVKPGKYVVAVSGGVDSVVLLDLLAAQKDLSLVVAHFDHGIRDDSAADADFVAELAQKYDLPFVTERVELGEGASEAAARELRYTFLQRVRPEQAAQAIITAHHQDDVLETAILNIIRGTGRRGLSSLQSTDQLVRPLLDISKAQIEDYAIKHKLSWHNDTTNHDERYTRNYIRHRLLVRFNADARQQLLAILQQVQAINSELDDVLGPLTQATELSRLWFSALPYDVATEVMASWLRAQNVADFDRKTIARLTVGVKTKPPGKRIEVLHGRQLLIGQESLALTLSER